MLDAAKAKLPDLRADASAPVSPAESGPARSSAHPGGQPRAEGEVRVSVRLRGGASRLAGLYQRGSSKCLLPEVGGAQEAVFLNTAGGLTGGDRFAWTAEAQANAFLTVATQTAERIYRAQPQETAQVRTRLILGPGARLDWLPQETILFDRGALDRRLEIEMDETAELLAVEPLILGRQAMGETVEAARFRDAWRLRRNGRLVWADALRLVGPVADLTAHGASFAGFRAAATVLRAGPSAEAALGSARNLLAQVVEDDPQAATEIRAGVSAFAGICVIRLLARDGRALRRALTPLLETLRGAPLPRVWTM